MVRDGIYYALAAFVLAALLAWLTVPALAAVPILLGIFFLWFFRDPERVIPATAGAIVSPADGKVTSVGRVDLGGRSFHRISIFLNVFDVHVNRSPVAGVITHVEYKKGRFANAMGDASADSNEQNIVTVESEGQTVIFKQIAGLIARRIVFNKRVGDHVAKGERVGLIKFGSRTDVLFSSDAAIKVKVGDRVSGGSTVLAVVPVSADTGTAGSSPTPQLATGGH